MGSGRYPEVPARHIMMNNAKIELGEFLSEQHKKYNTTPAERINMLASEIAELTHYAIKSERQLAEEKVEAAVKRVGDDIREAVSKPLNYEHERKMMEAEAEKHREKLRPLIHCSGLMTADQLRDCFVLGLKPGKCCERSGEHNGQARTDDVVLFPCNCDCHG